MRIAISLEVQEGLDFEQVLAVAQMANAHEVDALLLADHYYSTSGPGGSTMVADAWVYLAALARETSRLKLGTLVSPVTFRHPAVYAKMAATLDHISHGRAELGLGAGWLASEHSAYGFPFPDGPARVSMVAEQLQIIAGLWSGDPFSFAGRYYSLAACVFTPRCIQNPRVPILVGGRPTSRRLLRLARQWGDEYVLTRGDPEQCRVVKNALLGNREGRGRLVRLGLFTRLAMRGYEGAACYAGKQAPRASSDQWLVGSETEVLRRIRQLEVAGVDRVYVSVERPAQAAAAVAVADAVAGC